MANDSLVEISCPRCSGEGRSSGWHPDHGVCYRCGGTGKAQIDPKRHMFVLRKLRGRYVALKARLMAARKSDSDMVRAIMELGESLEKTVSDGKRLRHELELAGVDPDD